MHRSISVKTLPVLLLTAMSLTSVPVSADETGPILLTLATGTAREPVQVREHMGVTDRVKTGDGIFARLLLGGRVMVLARDGATLRITEVPGAATVEIESGRIAVTVDRENLHPEDLIEIRTPHAAVSVPAETLIVEVAQAHSTFTALGARVEVFRLDPATGVPVEPPAMVVSEQVITVPAATDVAAASADLSR